MVFKSIHTKKKNFLFQKYTQKILSLPKVYTHIHKIPSLPKKNTFSSKSIHTHRKNTFSSRSIHTHTHKKNPQDLTSKPLFLFQKFDIDDDKSINFQEFYEGYDDVTYVYDDVTYVYDDICV